MIKNMTKKLIAGFLLAATFAAPLMASESVNIDDLGQYGVAVDAETEVGEGDPASTFKTIYLHRVDTETGTMVADKGEAFNRFEKRFENKVARRASYGLHH